MSDEPSKKEAPEKRGEDRRKASDPAYDGPDRRRGERRKSDLPSR